MKLKNIILLALVSYGSWNYASKNGIFIKDEPASHGNNKSVSTSVKTPKYECDGRQHCSQMSSYEEAKYFLRNCPSTKMDGDNDGVPCESQFGH